MRENEWTPKRKSLCNQFWDDCAQEECEEPCEVVLKADKLTYKDIEVFNKGSVREIMLDRMRELGFEKDLKECLKQLSDTQRMEHFQCYTIEEVFKILFLHDSTIPIVHLKDPSTEEQIEIIITMGDARDVLDDNEISYHPALKDLTEEQAGLITDNLSDNDDFDYPRGDACNL